MWSHRTSRIISSGRSWREARATASFYRGYYEGWESAPRLFARHLAGTVAPAPIRSAWTRLRRRARLAEVRRGSVIRGDFAERVGVDRRIEALWRAHAVRASDPRAHQAAGLAHPLVAVALERYDRVASAFGVDVRHPFLDRRVVEYALALPWSLKTLDGWSKRIVREATAGLLPDDVRWRRGRWVRLGPTFTRAFLDASGDQLAAMATSGLAPIRDYVDTDRLRIAYDCGRRPQGPVCAEAGWQALHLGRWLARHDPDRVDRRAPENRYRESVTELLQAG